jgi:Tol biopolymer transport system component
MTTTGNPAMGEERWRQIERLYQEALTRPAEERAEFVEAACTSDADLRRDVLELLAEADPPSTALRGPVIAMARQLADGCSAALVGRRLGTYELEAWIGAGSMGEVYRARDTKLERTVAMKILAGPVALDPTRLERFRREAQLLAALNHPHIAAIYELAESDGLHFLVLEYVGGGSLADRLLRGPLRPEEAVATAKQIAAALSAAHEQGIVHRDLKPANIALTVTGNVKVLDFGLAKIAAAPVSDNETLTAANMIVGTPSYMSPEQAHGTPVGKAADVWAFGCVLFEMLAGTRAFSTAGDLGTQPILLNGTPDWRSLPSDLPRALQIVVRRCLSADSRQRVVDFATVSFLLNEATPSSELWPDDHAAGTTLPRRIAVIATVGVAVLLASLVAVIALKFRDRVPQPAPEMRFEIHSPASTRDIVISPDGQRLAYVAGNGGPPAIWIRPLDALVAQRLGGTDGATGLFWAPDSRYLAFFADGKLKRVDVTAGGVHAVCDAATTEPGAWSPDGIILFAAFFGGRAGIARVRAEGGEVVQVTTADVAKDFLRLRPQFLPDGRHFLYHALAGWEQSATLNVGSLDSAETRHVMDLTNFLARGGGSAAAFVPPDGLLYVSDATLMLQRFDPVQFVVMGQAVPVASEIDSFSASASGVLIYRAAIHDASAHSPVSLAWFTRTGKPAGALPTSIGVDYVALSPDGRQVAVDDGNGTGHYDNPDIWTIDLARGTPLKLTFDPAFDGGPVWSPDGSRIVFGSIRNGNVAKLYEMAATGVGGQRLLLQGDAADVDMPQDWSSDGRYVLFQRVRLKEALAADLWVLPTAGDRQPSLYLRTPFPKVQAQLSPDARYVAYSTNETGRYEIVVQTFPDPARGRWSATAHGGTEPRWRQDGKELYYLAPDGQLMEIPARLSPSFDAGEPKVLFHTPLEPQRPIPISRRYAVTADGQRFLVVVPSPSGQNDAPTTSITVVANASVLKPHQR